ncbi:hypothetical protein OG874_00345 [Nocardia sp. NBC_00565]|uniref:hypothetical protein n=1 Tax=Nocardia sp. NBC_00565 TaxID=2975993 RepID=UPI002E8048E9|nr:hypothetical protein [Nocardia sp. NBC_00565]WUC03704.1 hypothetical protein OG874_00345 [Nocardia sp. NBC_00565]
MSKWTEDQVSLPAWVVPGGKVFELLCTTRGYRTLDQTWSTIDRATAEFVTLVNGARYRIADLSTDEPATFHRDGRSDNRYVLMVGPADPRIQEEGPQS